MIKSLSDFDSLRVMFDKPRTDAASKRILQLDTKDKRELAIENPGIGMIFMLRDEGAEPAVIEVMIKDRPAGQEDMLSVLYHPHPIFASRESYKQARQWLIDLICDLADAGPDGVAFKCNIRGRKAHVRDMALQQLVDIVRTIVTRATH